MSKSTQYLYYYDSETGHYMGAERINHYRDGSIIMPSSGATLIPPPSDWPPNCLYFDKSNNCWQLGEIFLTRNNQFWHYQSGVDDNAYRPLELSVADFPCYPHFAGMENHHTTVMAICNKIRFVQQKYWEISDCFERYRLSRLIEPYYYKALKEQADDQLSDSSKTQIEQQLHGILKREGKSDEVIEKMIIDIDQLIPPIPRDRLENERAFSIEIAHFYHYRFELESLIYFMRSILDSFVQLTYLLTNESALKVDQHIKFNEIGKFLNIEPKTDIERILIGDGERFRVDNSYVIVREGDDGNSGMEIENHQLGFLDVINSVSNSFKHSFIHDGLYRIESGQEYPLVISCFVKFNDFNNERIYHEHNLNQMMIGFNQTVVRILENQMRYVLDVSNE